MDGWKRGKQNNIQEWMKWVIEFVCGPLRPANWARWRSNEMVMKLLMNGANGGIAFVFLSFPLVGYGRCPRQGLRQREENERKNKRNGAARPEANTNFLFKKEREEKTTTQLQSNQLSLCWFVGIDCCGGNEKINYIITVILANLKAEIHRIERLMWS